MREKQDLILKRNVLNEMWSNEPWEFTKYGGCRLCVERWLLTNERVAHYDVAYILKNEERWKPGEMAVNRFVLKNGNIEILLNFEPTDFEYVVFS